ncbi:hypothetical protein NPIL_394291, partial [Nephila pilipes]
MQWLSVILLGGGRFLTRNAIKPSSETIGAAVRVREGKNHRDDENLV